MRVNSYSYVTDNPLYTGLSLANKPLYNNSSLNLNTRIPKISYANKSNNRVAFSPLQARKTYKNNLKTLKKWNGKRNLGTGRSLKTKKSVIFSNGSIPTNNVNSLLPKSMISTTSNKTFGASVVPPTRVENAYNSNKFMNIKYNQNIGPDPNNDENDFFASPQNGETPELRNMRKAGLKIISPPKKKSWFFFGGKTKTLKKRNR